MRFRTYGVGAFTRALEAHNRKMGKAWEKASSEVGHDILEESQEVTPVDTGALQASGITYKIGSGWKTVVIVGFGEPVRGFFKGNRERHPEEYVLWQHDDPYNRRWFEETVDARRGLTEDLIFTYLSGV